MKNPANITAFALHGIICMIGLMGNTFIVAVNLMNWVHNRNYFNVRNQLVSILAIINICLHCAYFTDNASYFWWREVFFLDGVFKSYYILKSFFRACSLWFSTVLCIYYSIKIVNFNHPLLIQMKLRFPKMVPSLVMGSALICLAGSLPVGCDILIEFTTNTSCNVSSKETIFYFLLESGCFILFKIQALVYSVAFTIFSFSTGAIITSLYRHMRLMRQTAGSFQNPRASPHLNAMMTVTMLLALHASCFLSQCLLFVQCFPFESLGYIICELVTFACPALSSIILILRNPILKKTLTKIIVNAKCCRQEETRHIS